MFHPTHEEKERLLELIHKMQNLRCLQKQELFLILFMSKNGFRSREDYDDLLVSMESLLEIHSNFCDSVKEAFPTMSRKELYRLVSSTNEGIVGKEAFENGIEQAFGFVFERDDYEEVNQVYEKV